MQQNHLIVCWSFQVYLQNSLIPDNNNNNNKVIINI